MTLLALSCHESLRDAWSLCEHAKHPGPFGTCFSSLYFEVLLMECEQGGLLEHGFAFLKGPEGTAGNRGTEIGFGTMSKCVSATHLAATNEIKLPDSQWGTASIMRLAMLHLWTRAQYERTTCYIFKGIASPGVCLSNGEGR